MLIFIYWSFLAFSSLLLLDANPVKDLNASAVSFSIDLLGFVYCSIFYTVVGGITKPKYELCKTTFSLNMHL